MNFLITLFNLIKGKNTLLIVFTVGVLLFLLIKTESCKNKRIKRKGEERLKNELVKENEDIKKESKRKVKLNIQYIENLRKSNSQKRKEVNNGKKESKKENKENETQREKKETKEKIDEQLKRHFEQLDNLLK